MIKNIHINFYVVKGKAQEIISCAENSEQNETLEKAELKIVGLILPLLKKIEKKSTYFVMWEGDYVESGSLKNQTELKCTRIGYTAQEMKKFNKTRDLWDTKSSLTTDPKHLGMIL